MAFEYEIETAEFKRYFVGGKRVTSMDVVELLLKLERALDYIQELEDRFNVPLNGYSVTR